MDLLTFDDLDAASARFDRDVRESDAIDGYCSSTDWILPAARWLEPGREPWVWRGEHGWAALSLHVEPPGVRIALALESMWGLSCPMVGRDRVALAREFCGALRRSHGTWEAVVLSGLEPDDTLIPALAPACAGVGSLRFAERSLRIVASLERGFEGFLSRRSRDFRRSAYRARRDAERAGLEVEVARPTTEEEARAAYQRCLGVEARSHKGRMGDGILGPHLRPFYADMIVRLARRGAGRVRFARLDGRDVGFLLGGEWEASFRALQCSYDEEFASLSVGNLLQLGQIEDLCTEGYARYDLGSDVPYKRRWAESLEDLLRVLVLAPGFGRTFPA